MTNGEFIEKAFYNQTKKREHGNLFSDSKGNIYSYGYHYPLLFTASDNDSLAFVNTTGYSNSTSKHIGHAHAATNYTAIAVELNGASLPLTLDEIHSKLGAMVVELKSEMDKKKRKDTQVYSYLQSRFDRALENYNKVKEYL